MTLTPLEVARELGAALRLNDDQFEAYKGRRTGYEADKVIEKIANGVALTAGLKVFASLYLPRFMEAYMEIFSRTDGSIHPTNTMVILGAQLTKYPLLSRWCREYDAEKLIITVAEYYMSCSFPFDFTKPELSINTLDSIELIDHLMKIIHVASMAIPLPPSPSTNFYPHLSSTFRTRFDAQLGFHSTTMQRFEESIGKKSNPRDLNLVDNAISMIAAVRTFLRCRTADVWRKEWTQMSGIIVWWGCQWCESREKDKSCVKRKEGEEMLGCGRCKSVKYCGAAHQKADWKTHKSYCHEPTW